MTRLRKTILVIITHPHTPRKCKAFITIGDFPPKFLAILSNNRFPALGCIPPACAAQGDRGVLRPLSQCRPSVHRAAPLAQPREFSHRLCAAGSCSPAALTRFALSSRTSSGYLRAIDFAWALSNTALSRPGLSGSGQWRSMVSQSGRLRRHRANSGLRRAPDSESARMFESA